MALELLFKAMVLGVTIAAPLGPVGMLCINRTLERGFAAGMAGGVGTAIADAIYAGCAAFGLAMFSAFLSAMDVPLRLFGGGIIIWLGWRSMAPRNAPHAANVQSGNLIGTAVATFALTLTNPMTILFFAAIFAGLGLSAHPDLASTGVIVLGVFAGSMMWWLTLSGGITLFRHHLSPTFVRWISWLSGGILIVLGLVAIISLFVSF